MAHGRMGAGLKILGDGGTVRRIFEHRGIERLQQLFLAGAIGGFPSISTTAHSGRRPAP